MSRYIDADELERKYMSVDYMDNDTAYDVIAELDTAPHIDIVRCKECRHWCNHKDADYDQSEFTYYCEVHGISLTGNDFCSFGERREP